MIIEQRHLTSASSNDNLPLLWKERQLVIDDPEGGEQEERSIASAQISIKLTETELKLDELREKLGAAEKEARILRDQNEKMTKSAKSGKSGDDEMMNKMQFLEEQNAAYAASLKALTILPISMPIKVATAPTSKPAWRWCVREA